jgi:HSP20 family molecular chaperone IbpA
MTTRTILFDSPFLLGFDHTRALIDRAQRAAADSYPPYNVEQRGERSVRITLAVAGFGPDDLAITLEGRQLTIAGKREDGRQGGPGLPASRHRRSRLRAQLRARRRAGGRGGRLEHGLLHVDMVRPRTAEGPAAYPHTTG